MREGWCETNLADVADLVIGRTPSRSEKEYWTSDLTNPFCSIADMDGKWISPSREGVTQRAITEGKARLVPAGTLMMSFKLTLGRVGFSEVDLFPNEAIVAIDVAQDKALKEYLYFLLGSQDLTHDSVRAIKGATLNSKSLAAIPLLLPPIQEQRRIVNLISSVDNYIESLKKQSMAARAAQNAVLHDQLTAVGDDWTETILGEVITIQSGFAFSAKDWTDHGYPVIKINNVRNGKVSLESCSYIADPIPKGAEKFLLTNGDLLITLTGEIGATGTVSQDIPMYLNQRVGKINILDKSKALLTYIEVFLNHHPVRKEMWTLSKGNAQLNVSPKSIQGISLQLPPLRKQKEIVEIISSMYMAVQKIDESIAKTMTLREGLLADLLAGKHEIPESYDSFLEAV